MHFLISILIFVFLIRFILRLVFGFGGHRHRHFHRGWGNNYYNNGYGGYGGDPFGYGSRRGGGLFSILALVALDRLFTRRF